MKRLLLLLFVVPCIAEINDSQEVDFFNLGDDEHGILDRKDHEVHFIKGNNAFKAGNLDEAIKHYRNAIQCNNRTPQTFFNLGLVLDEKGQKDEAADAYRKATILKPSYTKAHYQLGLLLLEKDQKDQAISHFCQSLKYDTNQPALALKTARLLCEQEKFTDSIPYYEIAVKHKPDDIIARFEYANSLNTSHRTQEALDQYLILLKQRPEDSSILYNTAYTYKKLGRLDEAMPYYDMTLKKKPDHAEAHFSLGLAHLIEGNFSKGWPEYEWRWQRGTQLSPRDLKQPQWDGTPLHGKKILLHAEQGLGDTFQFIRYAKVVKEQYGGYVIVGVQSPLHVFTIRCCPYIDKVIPLSHIFNEPCDVQIPLMTLPLILNTTQETVPTDIPYLFADEALVRYWEPHMKKDNNFKVGICWQGNSKYSSPFLRSVVAAKSIPLKLFAPLFNIPGVSFYSLQKTTGEEQLNECKQFNLKTFDNDFDESHGRFMDTAAVMSHLDLIITIDTSISHLSAALGKPVWIMVPEPPDWRWMLHRTDTPWYPDNMKLFRQPTQGDWESVLHTISQELHAIVSGQRKLTFNVHDKNAAAHHTIKQMATTGSQTQLREELSLLNQRINDVYTLIKSSRSPDDDQVAKNMRTFYFLNQMRTELKEKIALLEGV